MASWPNRPIRQPQGRQPTQTPVCILDAPLYHQLSVNGLGKQESMAEVLGPCKHMGEEEETPGSQLWISSVLASGAI